MAVPTTDAGAAATSANTNTGMELDCPVDPNEPTYCFCQQVSYGEMVACDNPQVCSYDHSFCFLLDIFSQVVLIAL